MSNRHGWASGKLTPAASLSSPGQRKRTYDLFEKEVWPSSMTLRVSRLVVDQLAGFPTPISGDLVASIRARIGSEPPC